MQQKEIEKYEAIAARGLVLFSATLIAALIFFAFVFPWLKAPMPEMVVLNLTNFPRIALDSPDSTMGISVRTQVQNVSLPIAKRLPLNGIEAMWFLKSGYHFAPNSPETGELNLSVYDSQGNAVGKAFGGTPETTFPNSMFDFILGSTDKVALEPIDDYCEATFSSLHRGGYGWLNITFDGVKSLRPIVYSASARKENVYYLHMKSDESSNAKYTSDYLLSRNLGYISWAWSDCKLTDSDGGEWNTKGLFYSPYEGQRAINDTQVSSEIHSGEYKMMFSTPQVDDMPPFTGEYADASQIKIIDSGILSIQIMNPIGDLSVGRSLIQLKGHEMIELRKSTGVAELYAASIASPEPSIFLDFANVDEQGYGEPTLFDSVKINGNEIVLSRWNSWTSETRGLFIGIVVLATGALGSYLFYAASMALLFFYRRHKGDTFDYDY